MSQDKFVNRHIGPNEKDVEQMLKVIGVKSVDELISQVMPASIRLPKPLDLPPEAMSEYEFAAHIRELAKKITRTVLLSGWDIIRRLLRQLSSATSLKTRHGTPPILRIRRKYRKDVWKHY